MAFRVCVIFPVLLLCLVHICTSLPKPKDGTLTKSDELIANNDAFGQKVQPAESHTETVNANELSITGRVGCQYGGEEPIEDEDCQRHCIPKGYSYGLCFNNVCSCV